MKDYVAGIAAGLIVGVILSWLYLPTMYYKEGQIDCINGAIYYKLNKQIDGSTMWDRQLAIVKH